MKGYLLDTNICVFFFRQKFSIPEKIEALGNTPLFISEVTLAELKYGAYKSERIHENLRLIQELIENVEVIPLTDTIDIYAKEKVRLKNLGTPIDDFDLLIASSALSKKLILVTDNLRHFERVKGLHVENWVIR
jgi:tRNA(fMet)-specific endonuclease VapC